MRTLSCTSILSDGAYQSLICTFLTFWGVEAEWILRCRTASTWFPSFVRPHIVWTRIYDGYTPRCLWSLTPSMASTKIRAFEGIGALNNKTTLKGSTHQRGDASWKITTTVYAKTTPSITLRLSHTTPRRLLTLGQYWPKLLLTTK